MRSFDASKLIKGTAQTVSLSGIVRDYVTSDPVSRKVRLHDKHGVIVDTTVSGVDGTYSFTTSGNQNDEFELHSVGEPGERGELINQIAGA